MTSEFSRKRISILLPDLRGGGVERVTVLLASSFLKKGYMVDLVLMQKRGELLENLPKGIRIIDLHSVRIRNAFIPLFQYFRKERPDAVIVRMWPLTIIGVLAHRFSFGRSKLLLSDHNYLPSTPQGQGISGFLMKVTMRLFYPLADEVVTVSKGVKEIVCNLSGLKSEKVKVIYNPVQLEYSKSNKIDTKIELWWRESDFKVIAIGSLKEQKDFDTLIRSFAKVRKVKDAKLLILGEGVKRGELEILLKELNLQDYVMLAGFKADPYPYLKIADLFVLSSRYEGFGNVIVEALACGTPVVSTDCKAGPSEILDAGKYGVLVPVGEPSALSQAIIKSLCDTIDQQRLINRAKMFSIDEATDHYLKLLVSTEANIGANKC